MTIAKPGVPISFGGVVGTVAPPMDQMGPFTFEMLRERLRDEKTINMHMLACAYHKCICLIQDIFSIDGWLLHKVVNKSVRDDTKLPLKVRFQLRKVEYEVDSIMMEEGLTGNPYTTVNDIMEFPIDELDKGAERYFDRLATDLIKSKVLVNE